MGRTRKRVDAYGRPLPRQPREDRYFIVANVWDVPLENALHDQRGLTHLGTLTGTIERTFATVRDLAYAVGITEIDALDERVSVDYRFRALDSLINLADVGYHNVEGLTGEAHKQARDHGARHTIPLGIHLRRAWARFDGARCRNENSNEQA